MVKVLHVNYSDIKGGAAIGVNRFHQALLKSGIDSKILVCDKNSNDDKVLGPSSTIELFLNQLKISISRYIKRKLIRTENKETFSFNFFNTKILNKINKQDVDIVHLHWIGNEMISIKEIAGDRERSDVLSQRHQTLPPVDLVFLLLLPIP